MMMMFTTGMPRSKNHQNGLFAIPSNRNDVVDRDDGRPARTPCLGKRLPHARNERDEEGQIENAADGAANSSAFGGGRVCVGILENVNEG